MNNDYLPDLEKCPYCDRFITTEQAEHHICNTPLIDVQEIPVLFYYETQNKNGDGMILARGFDGVLYRLLKSKKPLKISSDDFLHKHKSDKDFTEPLYVNVV